MAKRRTRTRPTSTEARSLDRCPDSDLGGKSPEEVVDAHDPAHGATSPPSNTGVVVGEGDQRWDRRRWGRGGEREHVREAAILDDKGTFARPIVLDKR